MRGLALSLVVSFGIASSAAAQSLPDYAALHDHLKQRVEAARAREAAAISAVERVNRLVTAAQTTDDRDAHTVATAAAASAERTLTNARSLRARRERELEEFERAIREAARVGRPIGYPVLMRQGEISLVKPGSRSEYDGSVLKPGDRISTGPNSTIVILLPDAGGTRFTLGPNSTMEVGSAESSGGMLSLARGAMRELVKCLRDGYGNDGYCIRRRFAVRHPPTFSVRGTEYSAEIIDPETIRLEVFDGVVDLRDEADRLIISIERGTRVTLRLRAGLWEIVPEGVGTRRSRASEFASRSARNSANSR